MHAIEKFEVFNIRVEQAWLQLHYVCEEHTYQAHHDESYRDQKYIWQEIGILHIPDCACYEKMKTQVEGSIHDLTPAVAEKQDKREHFHCTDPEGTQLQVVVSWNHLAGQCKCNFTIKQSFC